MSEKITSRKKAEDWWKTAGQNDKKRYKYLYKDLRFKIQEPILEIGGGNGSFLDYVGINDATILDIGGFESLKSPNYKFVRTDITKKLPNLNKKFKTIFVMETLEHIKNPLYLMGQVYELLDKSGICYIAVPYTKLYPKRDSDVNPFNCHVARWKEKELLDQMTKLGFDARVIQKRRRFKNTAFWLPHCWLVLELKKRLKH